MNNVSSLKSNKTESPKTPGGISRSLLTPCRRIGLSRNWRKSGPSPFQSPLPTSGEVKQEKADIRKRKGRILEVETPTTEGDGNEESIEPSIKNVDIHNTPIRNIELPRRKKSKTVLTPINKSNDNLEPQSPSDGLLKEIQPVFFSEDNVSNQNLEKVAITEISTPVCLKSKNRSLKKISSVKSKVETKTDVKQDCGTFHVEINENICHKPKEIQEQELYEIKKRSPNNLQNECIVVIQKKIFKKEIKDIKDSVTQDKNNHSTINDNAKQKSVSQSLFDSDSDEVPLSILNKNEIRNKTTLKPLDEGDDFAVKTITHKVNKTEDTKSLSTLNNNSKKLNIIKVKNDTKTTVLNTESNEPSSQSSFDDDFEHKRTILIRKTYEKIPKPQRAKSTGSITQQDIDELKARIEAKKKLLLVKAMTEDTKELRELIKKWQKGCQDALMELMNLMKNKFPDRQNMDYSEILQSLKIPASLVGYDSENESFNTPDDASIISAHFNHL